MDANDASPDQQGVFSLDDHEPSLPSAPSTGEIPTTKSNDTEGSKEENSASKNAQTSDDTKKHAKILQQIHYYFSDENLETDDFLLRHITKSSNGYLRISFLCSFKRMQKLKVKPNVVSDALSKSHLLELSPDRLKVRRIASLPFAEYNKRTVVIDNFPIDTTEQSLLEMFSKCGIVERVLMPSAAKLANRDTKEVFASVRFQTESQAQAAIDKYNDATNSKTGLRVRLKSTLVPIKRSRTDSNQGKNITGHSPTSFSSVDDDDHENDNFDLANDSPANSPTVVHKPRKESNSSKFI